MPQRRISVQNIREIMRLKFENNLTHANIANSCGLSQSAIGDCLKRARVAGFSWPLDKSVSDDFLVAKLYPGSVGKIDTSGENLPDWGYVHKELRRKGVTRALLWEEYRHDHPEGIGYSRFCSLHRQWAKSMRLSMKQNHIAGEKLFVDYSGHTAKITDRKTGAERKAEIFVAVWGASNFTYAEATWSQTLPDWLGSHVRAFEFFGCVPQIVVPDCLRSAVSKACRYDPEKNESYAELARHYKVAVIPARPRKPKDKPKAEKGVQVVSRWILAKLRNRKFFTLEELNRAIHELLTGVNAKKFQKMDGSRQSLFEELDLPAARALPAQRYYYVRVFRKSINIDYHVEVEGHFYSVPYKLRSAKNNKLLVRLTETSIEFLCNNRRVCSHPRSYRKYGYSTIPDHMPIAHRKHMEWTPQRLSSWGRTIGPDVEKLITAIFGTVVHPEQGYRQCLGVIRLAKKFGPDRLNKACRIAIDNNLVGYRHIRSILESGRDKQLEEESRPVPVNHSNIRGGEYYSNLGEKKDDDQCDTGEHEKPETNGNGQVIGRHDQLGTNCRQGPTGGDRHHGGQGIGGPRQQAHDQAIKNRQTESQSSN